MTEVSVPQSRVCGTVCHRTYDKTSRVSSINWKHFCLGVSQPRRTVTVCYSAPQKYSYLLGKDTRTTHIARFVLWCCELLIRHEMTGIGTPSAAQSNTILPFTVTSSSSGSSVIVGATANAKHGTRSDGHRVRCRCVTESRLKYGENRFSMNRVWYGVKLNDLKLWLKIK